MKLYFIVEGERTEMELYPKWLSFLLPELEKVDAYKKIKPDSYFLFCGMGIPAIYNHVINAIKDINEFPEYDYLIVCLDGENAGVEIRKRKLIEKMTQHNVILNEGCLLKIIVHNVSVEIWFLGNRKVIKQNPAGNVFNEYLRHYNVKYQDPELMECKIPFTIKAQFHQSYLREAFKEHNLTYSKSRPGHVLDRSYFDELVKRVNDFPTHLQSLADFFAFVNEIKQR